MTIENAPTLQKVLREPSAEVFTEFAQIYGVTVGKFVRLGSTILIAPFVKLEDGSVPRHGDMINGNSNNPNPELSQNGGAVVQNEGLSGCPVLMDAGIYETRHSKEGQVTTVYVQGESGDYGQADKAGRLETAAIMRNYLAGTAIAVDSL